MPTLASTILGFRRSCRPAALAVTCALALGLAGCDHNPDETAAQCPKFSLLPGDDGASLARYTPRGHDLTDLVLSGHITDIRGACIGVLGSKQVRVKAHLVMVLTRGPASSSPEADIPYGMGVVKRGQIIGAPQFFTQHVAFPPNTNSIQVEGQEVDFVFPTPKGLLGPDYHVYVFFRLSPEELALGRKPK